MFQPAYFNATDFTLNVDLNFLSTLFKSKPGDEDFDELQFSEALFELQDFLHGSQAAADSVFGENGLLLQLVMRHEQRHFLDHILTNYGARRVHRSFAIIANLGPLLHIGQKYGKLICPVDVYADHLKMKYRHRLDEADLYHMRFLGKMFVDDRRFFTNDRRLGQKLSQKVPLDGVAFLEGLAEGFECPLEHELSPELSDRINGIEDRFQRKRFLGAIASFLEKNGVKIVESRTENSSQFHRLNGGILYPLLIASLMTRQGGGINRTDQDHQEAPEFEHKATFPSIRFSEIVGELSNIKSIDVTSAEEGFGLIDSICRKIFGGVGIAAEMQRSCDFSENLYSKMNSEQGPTVFLRDYVLSRKMIHEKYVSDPSYFGKHSGFSKGPINDFLPSVIFRDQNAGTFTVIYGSQGEPESIEAIEKRHRIEVLQTKTYGSSELFGIVGVSALKLKRADNSAKILDFTFSESGQQELRQVGPIVDLLVNGQMLQLEREALTYGAVQEFAKHEIKIEIDEGFQFPRFNRREPEVLEYIFTTPAHCPLSEETLVKDESILVSSNEIRDPKILKKITEATNEQIAQKLAHGYFGYFAVHQKFESIFE